MKYIIISLLLLFSSSSFSSSVLSSKNSSNNYVKYSDDVYVDVTGMNESEIKIVRAKIDQNFNLSKFSGTGSIIIDGATLLGLGLLIFVYSNTINDLVDEYKREVISCTKDSKGETSCKKVYK